MCLLTGHSAITIEGVGDYRGRTVTICRICGKDLPAPIENDDKSRPRGYESAAKEFFNER